MNATANTPGNYNNTLTPTQSLPAFPSTIIEPVEMEGVPFRAGWLIRLASTLLNANLTSVYCLTTLLIMACSVSTSVAQNVGISNTSATPDPSAMLDIVSGSKGLLLPRVALTATNVAAPVTAPAVSLLVYNLNTAGVAPNNVMPGYYYWDGAQWVSIAGGTTVSNTYNTTTGNLNTTVNGVTGASVVIPTAQNITDSVTAQAWLLKGNNANATDQLGTLNARNLTIITNNATRISVMSGTGNVGIGQTLPAEKLDVIGNIKTTGSVEFGTDIKPAGLSGITGDVLISQGAGVAPTWVAQSTIAPATTNTLASAVNTITSTVNGITATAPAVNTVANAYSTTTGAFNTTVNGVAGANVVIPTPQGIKDSVTNNAWLLKGNSGTVDGVNFIGTTDNVPINVKVNNQRAGRIDNTLFNTYYGYQAGDPSTGASNTFVGTLVGNDASGSFNLGLGRGALFGANNTGSFNIALGSSLVAPNLSGAHNIAIGHNSLASNTTGANNVALGQNSLVSNIGGSRNTSFGFSSLNDNTTGSQNVSVGYASGDTNSVGSNNTFIGSFSKPELSNLTNATAIGYNAKVGASNSLVLGGTGADAVKVGIGTTTPTEKLELTGGGIRINNSFGIGFNERPYDGNSTNDAAKIYYDSNYFGAANDGLVIEKTDGNGLIADGGIAFTNKGTDNIRRESMVIRGNGNVGIANTLPNNKLEITHGTAGNSGLRFTNLPNITVLGTNASGDVIPSTLNPANALYWGLTGNAGTTLGTNFVGTTDNADLVFKRNNVQAGLINNALQNTALGVSALNPTTTGSANTALGFNALLANTTGSNNTGLGASVLNSTTTGSNNTAQGNNALRSNTTGRSNVAVGIDALRTTTTASNLVAVGDSALRNNTTGVGNTAIGSKALTANTTGVYNTALGNRALLSNTSGRYNIAVGDSALPKATIANNNIAIGSRAMLDATTAYQNIAIGTAALNNNTTGDANVAIGDSALYNGIVTGTIAIGSKALLSNTTASFNLAVGDNALRQNTTGNFNLAIGKDVLRQNTTANYNMGIGYTALTKTTTGSANLAIGSNVLASNLIGTHNIGLGYLALNKNDSGDVNIAIGNFAMQNQHGNRSVNNVAIGYFALNKNDSGYNNVAIGPYVLQNNISGVSNTAIGTISMRSNTTGSSNTAIGFGTLLNNTTGGGNTALGTSALYNNTSGINNIALGSNTLNRNTTGSLNTAVGLSSLLYSTTAFNNSAIGYNSLYYTTTGSDNTGVGLYSLRLNTTGDNNTAVGRNAGYGTVAGNNNTAIGSNTMVYINSNKNTALGYKAFNGAFVPLVPAAKTTPSSNVNVVTNTVTITGHGFGTAPALIFVQITSTGTVPAPYTAGSVFNASIIDANTIGFSTSISTQGTGTLTFTPHDTSANQYANSTAIGYDAQPTASNQIQLGDGNVTEVRTRGTLVPSITNTADVGTALLRWRNAYFAGSVNASCGVLVCSDARYKQQITPLTNSLAKLTKLQGVNYYFKTEEFKDRNFNTNLQIGVIAQDAEKILPEVVSTDAAGYKSVDYSKFTPLLIEAIKEQQAQIELLRKEIEALKRK